MKRNSWEMSANVRIFGGFIVLLLLTGCATVFLAHGGVDMSEVFKNSLTRDEIQKRFNSIDASVPYASPTDASEVQDLRAAMEAYSKNFSKQISDRQLWGYEDYTFKGWIKDQEMWQGLGMVDGMTLGVGGWFFAGEVKRTKEHQKDRVHRFRVWYDQSGHYFAHQEFFDSDWAQYNWPPDYEKRISQFVSF